MQFYGLHLLQQCQELLLPCTLCICWPVVSHLMLFQMSLDAAWGTLKPTRTSSLFSNRWASVHTSSPHTSVQVHMRDQPWHCTRSSQHEQTAQHDCRFNHCKVNLLQAIASQAFSSKRCSVKVLRKPACCCTQLQCQHHWPHNLLDEAKDRS